MKSFRGTALMILAYAWAGTLLVVGAALAAPARDDKTVASLVERLEKLGGKIEYGASKAIVGVEVLDEQCDDEDMPLLAAAPGLRRLRIRSAGVSDKGLACLDNMKELKDLGLLFAAITDKTLSRIAPLTKLESLDLRGCIQITDKGLANLKGLKDLKTLRLQTPSITDAGLASLAGLTSLETLILRQTDITDTGLVHLRKLRRLKELSLEVTAVTDQAKQKIASDLPDCKIE